VSSENLAYNIQAEKKPAKLLGAPTELSATRYTAFKVIWSNIDIAITPPRIARLNSNLVPSFIMTQMTHCKCLRSNIKGQGHSVR